MVIVPIIRTAPTMRQGKTTAVRRHGSSTSLTDKTTSRPKLNDISNTPSAHHLRTGDDVHRANFHKFSRKCASFSETRIKREEHHNKVIACSPLANEVTSKTNSKLRLQALILIGILLLVF